MQWDSEAKKIYLQIDGGIAKIDPTSGKVEKINISGDMVLDVAAERRIMFEHVVRRTADIFYKQDFHGIDWSSMSAAYRRHLRMWAMATSLANC